jgi:hypothetical protein
MSDTEAAAVRLTAGQRRAARDVLEQRGSYPSMEALADALALAVLTAEDDNNRRVVCVREAGAFYVFGPYATPGAAEKAIASGLATREGARGGVFPLIPAPKATRKKRVKA